MNESGLRERLCATARSLHERGLTHGSTGNVSLRCGEGWLMTPTGSTLGSLDPATLSLLDPAGRHIGGHVPTKEQFLHLAMYRERPGSGAVIHLHATHSVGVSVLEDVNPEDVLPPMTAYYVMRVGTLPLVPYHPPGDPGLAEAVRALAGRHHALLLANHGPIVAGTDLAAAADAVEELEATARLHLLLQGRRIRTLTPDQVAELRRRFAT